MSCVYLETENWVEDGIIRHHLYTVGFYAPDGSFKPESDHEDKGKAAQRVAWLNGGGPEPSGSSRLEYQCVDCYDDVWRWCIVANYDGQCGDVLCVLHAEDGSPLGDLASRIISSGVLK